MSRLPPIIESEAVPEGTVLLVPPNLVHQLGPRRSDEGMAAWLRRAFAERPDVARQCAAIIVTAKVGP
jgi:hypothetical protein